MASQVVTSVELQVLEIRSYIYIYIRGFHAFRGSVVRYRRLEVRRLEVSVSRR